MSTSNNNEQAPKQFMTTQSSVRLFGIAKRMGIIIAAIDRVGLYFSECLITKTLPYSEPNKSKEEAILLISCLYNLADELRAALGISRKEIETYAKQNGLMLPDDSPLEQK